MGLAFIENIYGSSAMGPLMIIGAVPLYNIFSVIVLTFEANEDGAGEEAVHGGRIKKAFLNILKNPIILGIAFGMVAALLSLDFPTMVDKTIENVAKMATPLVIQPLLLLPVAAALGFTGEKMIAILIMLASPTTPSCYIMAKNMKNDGVLTASIIVTTTLLGAFTLTGWIFILKTMGLI